jgi:hypothetical protein
VAKKVGFLQWFSKSHLYKYKIEDNFALGISYYCQIILTFVLLFSLLYICIGNLAEKMVIVVVRGGEWKIVLIDFFVITHHTGRLYAMCRRRTFTRQQKPPFARIRECRIDHTACDPRGRLCEHQWITITAPMIDVANLSSRTRKKMNSESENCHQAIG